SAKYANSAVWHFTAGSLGVLLFCLALGPAIARPSFAGVVALRWFLIAQAGLISVLWLWDPRYMLPFVPALLAIMLCAAPIRRTKLALALIGVFVVVSVGE